ncbi:MAG: aminopeptidase P family N-terminal domain-containing protein [Actinomycetota bacterium]|nr:aminopeptidase P family N-terminal domain-containing protein [Actinomycetota bacterium]
MSESGQNARREKLRGLMEEAGAGAILLRRPANFAWYTGGADNRVDHSDAFGVAAVLVTGDGEYVISDNIEAPRMREEQTPNLEVAEHPWHEGPDSLIQELSDGVSLAADFSSGSGPDLSAEIAPLRYVLDSDAIERYRCLGTNAVAAVKEAAGFLSPETDEVEASAILVAACRRRGIFAPVLMASSGERMGRYRHAIPHGGPLGRRVMLVVCAERGGLFANHTRIVDFDEPDDETAQRQRACDEILNRMREEATGPGRTLADTFEDCRRYYAEAGFPDGWRDHHQGGLTGYASRELVASPSATQSIQPGQAFAWNPSLQNAKAEETFVLTANGPEILTPYSG